MEVEHIEYYGVPGSDLVWDREKIVIAQIVEVRAHPNADRLVLADVDYGGAAPHQVVTGAPNIFHLKGQGRLANGPKVVFATEGSVLYDGHQAGPGQDDVEAGQAARREERFDGVLGEGTRPQR